MLPHRSGEVAERSEVDRAPHRSGIERPENSPVESFQQALGARVWQARGEVAERSEVDRAPQPREQGTGIAAAAIYASPPQWGSTRVAGDRALHRSGIERPENSPVESFQWFERLENSTVRCFQRFERLENSTVCCFQRERAGRPTSNGSVDPRRWGR